MSSNCVHHALRRPVQQFLASPSAPSPAGFLSAVSASCSSHIKAPPAEPSRTPQRSGMALASPGPRAFPGPQGWLTAGSLSTLRPPHSRRLPAGIREITTPPNAPAQLCHAARQHSRPFIPSPAPGSGSSHAPAPQRPNPDAFFATFFAVQGPFPSRCYPKIQNIFIKNDSFSVILLSGLSFTILSVSCPRLRISIYWEIRTFWHK